MIKHLIGLTLANLALAAPVLGVLSNGFESNWCYANVSGGGGVNMYSQADGSLQGNLPGAGLESITFSHSAVAGAYSPAGARLFGAQAYDWDGNGVADDIKIDEWDSNGNLVRRSYLGNWALGGSIGNNAAPLRAGSIRYNPVNDTLIVAANVGNNLGVPSKAWEFELPDWNNDPGSGGAIGDAVTLVHTYTLPPAWRNRTNINIAPDGMMYITGYDLGSGGKTGKGNIYQTPTDPLDPNFGVNAMILNGAAEYASSGGSWYKPAGITYREMDNGIPEILVGMEDVDNLYQPYALRFDLSGQLFRVGTPGDDIRPANNRRRAIHAQTDPLTGESFIVGNSDGGTGMNAGVLQVTPWLPRNTGSQVFDQGLAITDAASPMPEPGALVLLAMGALPMMLRRRWV